MRSLRGVTIFSSVLTFGMFTHSATLISRLHNIYFGLPYLSQESIVLSQLQLAYLYYLELSLKSYKINFFEAPKSEKITTTK